MGRAGRRETRHADVRGVAAVGARECVDTAADGDHVQGDVGCEPDAVSMLHAARYVKAAGGIGRMLDVKGGAQQDRFPDGAQQIALRMAEELGSRVVLGAPATASSAAADGTVTVTSGRGTVTAKAVVVAIAPAHRAAIEFTPALPEPAVGLPGHWPQGSLSKAYAAYDTPFWRGNGCSGEALSDEGPVFITFDVSPGDDGPGILLGFTDARTFDPLPAQDRRDLACAGFAALFGEAALHPIDYVDHRWGAEDFAPGGPTAAVPPGSWTDYGRGCGSPSAPSTGPAPRRPTSGPASSTARCGRDCGRPTRSTARSPSAADAAQLGCRFGESAQLLTDLLRTLQDRAVTAGQLDQPARFGTAVGDAPRRGDRQQPILLAADHQRRHASDSTARCAAAPIESTSALAHPPRPAGGVSSNRS